MYAWVCVCVCVGVGLRRSVKSNYSLHAVVCVCVILKVLKGSYSASSSCTDPSLGCSTQQAFPLWIAMDSLWSKKALLRGSCDISAIRLPISLTKCSPSAPQTPNDSTAIIIIHFISNENKHIISALYIPKQNWVKSKNVTVQKSAELKMFMMYNNGKAKINQSTSRDIRAMGDLWQKHVSRNLQLKMYN